MHPVVRVILALIVILTVAAGGVFLHYYNQYAVLIDRQLREGLLRRPSVLYAAPRQLWVGERVSAAGVAADLKNAGYTISSKSPIGSFTLGTNSIEISPGSQSFHSPEAAQVVFNNGQIASLRDALTGTPLQSYDLEPEVLTTLFDSARAKRQLIHYDQIPPNLINAVLAAEDRDYFHHGAFNYWRIMAAAWKDFRTGRRESGASTIAMQVAGNFFLTGIKGKKTWRQKLQQAMIAFELEQRLSKQQIFEMYANEAYEGQHGTYSINGFAEAANAYFGKEVGQLTLPECALIAGIIHGPNADSPYRFPERALIRRNYVLKEMADAGMITPEQRDWAISAPMNIAPAANLEVSDAPYFVDIVRDKLTDHLSARDLTADSYRIYTTLDPDLQRAASDAVVKGMQQVDERLDKLYTDRRGRVMPHPRAQVALIALDPHTGDVKALIGGRSYAGSQLDHALALRPTGSIFKPIVYAAALNTGLANPAPSALTVTMKLIDQPTVFEGGYAPANFENKYYGQVTMREALEHSLNNATISLAQQVGYAQVASLAREAGIGSVEPTPSEAIGAYAATPLDMAGVYTIFANAGVRVQPRFIHSVQSSSGEVVYDQPITTRQILDPRVAYLVTNLMQSVLSSGTGVQVHDYGFDVPAAGKTGTSHDGWFAGYTSNLLCIVWVGMDDYSNLRLEGAHSALPIWARFMASAVKLPEYQSVSDFQPPAGVVAVDVDPESGQIATPACPTHETDYYLAGTQPTVYCQLHSPSLSPKGVLTRVFGGLFHSNTPPAPPPPAAAAGTAVPNSAARAGSPVATTTAAAQPVGVQVQPKKKKKGLFGRLFGALKSDPKKPSAPARPPAPQNQQ
jgi:penicillin-binding protein 1B